MAFHLFVFLLVIFLFLCLALLWRLCWFPVTRQHPAKNGKQQGSNMLPSGG
jgi:hypothetical protein